MPYHKTLTISFEFFPPKNPEGFKTLLESASLLAALHPDFFSITFGAGGSTREGTLESVRMLQVLGIPIAPHLTCLGLPPDEMIAIIKMYQSLGINRLVVLRGDLPEGIEKRTGLSYANELVALIREVTFDHFHIEVAAYPEMHPEAINANEDILHLKKKIAAGANSAITQYFFNPDAYFYFLDACLKAGITKPIVPGIMPITNFARLARFSAMCGAEIPRWIAKRLEAYGEDQASIQSFGLDVVSHLCDVLLQGGAPGLHFYTLNHSEASIKILEQLKLSQRST